MRKVLVSLAAVAAIAATPAFANEGRFEGHGGVVWDGSNSDATAGASLGYDWDVGPGTFVGAETSIDKVLASNERVSFGIGGRAGLKAPGIGKIYAVSSYQTKPCKACEHSVTLGAGVQHDFGPLYGKIEYRHYFVGNHQTDYDGAVAGIGLKF